MALLEVRNISKSYGGNRVLDDVSFDAEPGVVTGLIGPNGAGKSTLLNIISGFARADSGSVRIDGTELAGRPPYHCFKSGIARTFQDSQVFPYMTGMENVVISSSPGIGRSEFNVLLRPRAVRKEERAKSDEAMDLLGLVNLQDKAKSMSQALSYGQQKLLEFARMLNSQAKVFLLDEPMAGIHPDLIEGLGKLIADAAENHGKAVILVEHNLRVVMELCNHVVVVRGKMLLEGPPAEVSHDERLTGAFLGVG